LRAASYVLRERPDPDLRRPGGPRFARRHPASAPQTLADIQAQHVPGCALWTPSQAAAGRLASSKPLSAIAEVTPAADCTFLAL